MTATVKKPRKRDVAFGVLSLLFLGYAIPAAVHHGIEASNCDGAYVRVSTFNSWDGGKCLNVK